MDYRVEYWTSPDGTAIASGRTGVGMPLLRIPTLTGTLGRFDWRSTPEEFETITYDRRGTGLSDPAPPETTAEQYIEDIVAVIDGLQLERFILVGTLFGTAEALTIAIREPQRVAGLVLQRPFASVADWSAIPRVRALLAAMEDDWGWFTEAWPRGAHRWNDPSAAEEARYLREHFTPALLRQLIDGVGGIDVDADLGRIEAPTLVLHFDDVTIPASYSRRFAARIQRCEMAVVRDSELRGAIDQANRLTEDFARSLVAPNSGSASTGGSGFSTILFTDVVSSTPLLSQLRDERMREVMRDHDAVCEAAITEHGGRVVKTIGDAFMAEFSVPSAAIEAAIAIQRGVRERFADSDVPIRLRIGINAGEPIVEDDDLHGASVVIAKRLESEADSGGILVSDVVRQAVAGKDFTFEDRGEVELKGFDQPVRAWAVRWE